MSTDIAWREDGTPTDVPEGWLPKTVAVDAGMTPEKFTELKWRNDPAQVRRTKADRGASVSPWFFEPTLFGVIEAIPRRRTGYETTECIGNAKLKERGWTPAHIKRLLGRPDATMETAYRAAHLWAVERVEAAEANDAKLRKRLDKVAADRDKAHAEHARRQANAAANAEIARVQAAAAAEADFLASAVEVRIPDTLSEGDVTVIGRFILRCGGRRANKHCRLDALVPQDQVEAVQAEIARVQAAAAAEAAFLASAVEVRIPDTLSENDVTRIGRFICECGGRLAKTRPRLDALVPPDRLEAVQAEIARSIAEQIPRRPQAYRSYECIGTTKLEARGWTTAHIARVLGAPDSYFDDNPLWALERIESAEQLDDQVRELRTPIAEQEAKEEAFLKDAVRITFGNDDYGLPMTPTKYTLPKMEVMRNKLEAAVVKVGGRYDRQPAYGFKVEDYILVPSVAVDEIRQFIADDVARVQRKDDERRSQRSTARA